MHRTSVRRKRSYSQRSRNLVSSARRGDRSFQPSADNLQAKPFTYVDQIRDPRIPLAQRQIMVQQMGALHGNQYLQRVLSAAEQGDTTAEPILRPGSRLPAVQTMQQQLISAGASITADGVFGQQTQRAVANYQRAAGLSPDGVVGPQTWSSLKAGNVNIPATPATGGGASTGHPALVGAKLAQIQTILRNLRSSRPEAPAKTSQAEQAQSSAESDSREDMVRSDDEETSWWDEATSWVDEQVNEAADWIEETVDNVPGGYNEEEGTIGEDEGSWFDELTDWAEEKVENVWDKVNDVAGDVVDEVSDLAGGIWDLVAGPLETLIDLIDGGFEEEEDPGGILDRIIELLQRPPGSREKPVEGSLGPISSGRSMRGMACDKSDPSRKTKGRKPLKVEIDATLIPYVGQGQTSDQGIRMDPVNASDIGILSSVQQGEVSNMEGFGREEPKIDINYVYWKLEDDMVRIGAHVMIDCTWNIRSNDRSDITGPDSEHVEPISWLPIYNDLKPLDPFGQPAREHYWSSALTAEHEMYHASDDIGAASRALEEGKNQLNEQGIRTPSLWVSDEDAEYIQGEVMRLSKDLLKRIKGSVQAHFNSGGEARAYESGRGAYQQLVDSIKAKAERDGWTGKDE